MAYDNGHLVPVFIIYADGARLDTELEGVVRRIRVSDRLDGIGRCVIEFGHPAAALFERGAIALESAVDVHLGYKDDCAKVFGGEVTGLEYGYSEHCGECLRVTVSGRLHRLRNAVRSESYERKTAGGFVAEMLDRYGLKADVEDFGPEAEVAVHHLESDWDFLLEHAKRYGRSVYERDGTVYIKNEITVSRDDIVLEFGKSIISFRVKESLAAQISKCTYTDWNMMKAEGITGSAEVGEVVVKAGGGTSWADEARIFPGFWNSVIDSQGVRDAEDARNRALGTLQNASMEWQRAEVRCVGDHRIRPGMRVTLKYVGERFSGEYVAERVEHEFGVDGFITEVHLRRNMLPREPKRTSAIDEERERNMRNQIRNMNAGRQNKTDARATMFHIGKNMDGAQFVSSIEESISVDTSEDGGDVAISNIGQNMEEKKTSYTMSENGKTLLKKLEGCVKNDDGLLVSYNDSNNYATKGYGILICKSPLTDEIIAANPPQSEEQATLDFENKLAEFELIVNNRASYTYPNGVQTLDTLSLSETKADAIISLTYNSPKTAKKVMDAIRNGKTLDELKTIWMDGNSTDSGLGKRRAAEWKLYSEGTYEENPYD